MGRLLKNLINFNEQFSHVTQYYIKVYIDNLLHAIRKLRAQETLRLWGRVYFKVLEMLLFYKTHWHFNQNAYSFFLNFVV